MYATTEEFQKAIEPHLDRRAEPDPLAILAELAKQQEKIRGLCREAGMPADATEKALDRATLAAECRWMKCRYPTIDTAFAETARRTVIVRRTAADPEQLEVCPPTAEPIWPDGKGETQVEIPVFAHRDTTPEDLAKDYAEGNDRSVVVSGQTHVHLPHGSFNKRSYRQAFCQVRAKVPAGVTPATFQRIRRAYVWWGLFDLLLLDRGLREHRGQYARRSRPDLVQLWAPVDQALTVTRTLVDPDGDPAVLMRAESGTYLIDYYDTPDEQPIDHLIREFSDGPVGAVLGK